METIGRDGNTTLDDFYRTNDMAMVTYLKIIGHPVQRVFWEAGTCYWIFRVTEVLLSQIDQFLAGNARIEPREYNRVFNSTKREFYDTQPPQQVGRR